MSDTYIESVARATPRERAPAPVRSWTRWPKRIVLLLFLLWLAAEAMSVAIQHTRLRRQLTARLEAAFGRPVEVGGYDLSIWGGPVLNARSVIVAEDPRFGQEYFLRAESMSVRLRWQSLLRGRIELGTLSLTRPSLNLVRNGSGDWNLAEWLPRPAQSPAMRTSVGPSFPNSPLRFRRVEVSGGRINFKQGDDKLPLAFVDVSGTVETDQPGRWRMNLEATPWRGAVVLQQAGTIHFSGDVGGTSSRLRPAILDVSWTDASLSDMLRLARGDDKGIRGSAAFSLNARTHDEDDSWTIQARASLSQIHRWDLALRPDNPAVNLIARTEWRPASSDLELTQLSLEAPHSAAQLTGRVLWNVAPTTKQPQSGPVQLTVSSSTIDMTDLLAWARAFHVGVANDVSVRGLAVARGDFSGWPLRVANSTVSSGGVDVSGGGLDAPAHLGPVQVSYSRGALSLLPVTLSWTAPAGAPEGSFRLDQSNTKSAKPARNIPPAWHIAGSIRQVRNLIAGASAFGWNISRGWDLAGPFACDLRWPAGSSSWPPALFTQPVGWIEFGAAGEAQGGAALHAPFLNLPVQQINARVELKPGARHVALAAARAFGANWSGTFDRRDPASQWQFALAADHLSAADVDRWLNPAWRESFLDRMLPFLNSRTSPNAAPENLRATGTLALDQFTLAPLVVRQLQGDLKVEGRSIELTNAAGQFFGGRVNGSLKASLDATPAYHADLNFSPVDIPALIAATPSLAGLTAQSVAGQISFGASGATRADLVASLICQGKVRAAGPELLGSDLWKSLGDESQGAGSTRSPAASPRNTGSTRFSSGSATFSCSNRTIEFQSLRLNAAEDGATTASSIEGTGTVDFSRNLDLRFERQSDVRSAPPHPPATIHVTGSLAAPKVEPTSTQPTRRSR
jgi:hypothetical protein